MTDRAENDTPTRIPDHAQDIEARVVTIIEDGSIALAGVFKQLSLEARGLQPLGDSEERLRLSETTTALVELLGLSDIVSIQIPDPAEKLELAMEKSDLANALKARRLELGLNQTETAELLGLNRFAISRAENAHSSAATIRSILDRLPPSPGVSD